MDALRLLREDHVKVLHLLDQLERGPGEGRTSVTPQAVSEYRSLVTELIIAESEHEAVEEQYFWPSVQHWLDPGRELAEPALHQEQEAKKLLHRLDQLDVEDPGFTTLVDQAIADGRAHIDYEEQQVWPVIRERMATSELENLGEQMARAKKAAPTRPHPNTPPKPGVLKTAGAAAAAVDKLRDIVTGRGKD